ncbi:MULTISPECIES: cation-translocating P-type ATPase [unclassified Facklamia]|uniref:cation-translocating P-type ATPase n=1 Tax=Aerococcaceae TaxID=186827 RepID=UPI0013BD1674|nr:MULTISPECIES: cation-translocating P-type ATPase [unclassified Facklamia]NEW63947.1 HAD-IC family P-type ATPase [Facklamia sp. 252]NEW67418.1 HAD-IC family P-type ATPase [Facklamia sp. 253]QQD65293.1 cation-translocating P-type ATPase [Aerococcaceae bacterium zg-252]
MLEKDFIAYQLSAEEVVAKLQSDVANGLTDQEATKRHEEFGLNELEAEEKTTLLQKFFAQFKDFMIIVLLAAALVSVIAEGVHGLTDAMIILLVVILNAIIGVFQEAKAEEAIDALRKMASPAARVRRNGNVQSVKSSELVPGDIVLLEAGDVVPADVRLIEANSLQIEESALTGESVPVEKSIVTLAAGEEAGIGDRNNMAFSSTNVTYGRGLAVVTGTGMNTEVGHIASMLSSTEKQQTPLQRDQEQLGKTLTILILIIAAVTFVVGLLRGRAPLEMLLVAISLAVAAIPEGLPAISTIILSLGTRTMADRKALVRTLPAVETLGSTQVICSDKTGTLTVNKMTIEKVYYNGELHDASEQIDLNTPLLKAISFANDTEIDAQGALIGDPTETAMIKYALDKSFDLQVALAETPRVAEVPFDSTRKLMSTIHQLADGRYAVAVKGAPDQLLKRCTLVDVNGHVEPISQAQVDDILAKNTALAREALRVLAGAYKIIDTLPTELNSDTLEHDLIFAGLVGMIDPERKEAGDAIKVAREAGIRTVMITGDHAVTAQAIAERLGILDPNEANNETHVLTGAELDEISDDELAKRVANYSVYARVSPEHKVRIIRAWQANDVVVSMTGDGVNDAPSLKQADIGVGMGITGTEVSKGASDMVLADDNFETIVVAVEEGRKVFSNIQKAVQFLLSANLGEVITLFVATMLGWTILEPVHILWINLVTDVFPAIALGMEGAEKDSMKYAPRTSKDNFLSFGVFPSIVYQGVLEASITLFVYWYSTHVMGLGNDHGETMAFLTLGMIQLFHAYNVKSVFKSLFSSNPFANKYLNYAFVGSGAMLLMVVIIPFLRNLFDVVELSMTEWSIMLAAAASIIVFVEVIKFILRATGFANKYEKSGSSSIK